MKRFVLVGMPNCGKSSLFNRLTHAHAYTGNRAGVTVKAASARANVGSIACEIVDLPGLRSLKPVSADERAALHVLCEEPFDAVLLVCDASNFALQYPFLRDVCRFLMQKRAFPICGITLVLNLCDELEVFPNAKHVGSVLGVRTVAVSARTGAGLETLFQTLGALLTERKENDCTSCRSTLPFSASTADAARAVGRARPCGSPTERRIDTALARPWIGIPFLLVLLLATLYLTFGAFGEWLTALFRAACLMPLSRLLLLPFANAPAWLYALIADGLLGGVGAVLDFLPRLSLLFLLQALFEASGLLARFSRLADPFMRCFGLRGDALTPLLLGFGCTVPAIECTRAMKDERQGTRCASLLPMVACSARMPMCLLLADAFFGATKWQICSYVWLFSALCFLLWSAVLHLFSHKRMPALRHNDPPPRLRLPSAFEITTSALAHLKHFFSRAGGIILLASLLVWFLSSFTPHLQYTADTPDESLLAHAGRLISPLLSPLGLGSWQIAAALLAGLCAKEAAVSTLGVLLRADNIGLSRALAISGLLTPSSALSLLIFYTLYFPCAATVGVLRTEKHPRRYLLGAFITAYLLSFLAYRLL